MICPNCKANIPDTRDLCQRCFTDLRPEKKRLGIAIQHPDDDFDTLLKRATGKLVPTPQTPQRTAQPPPPKPAPKAQAEPAQPRIEQPPAIPERKRERPAGKPGTPEEIRAAIDEAWAEVGSVAFTEMELGVEQFARQLPLEEIELLFEIAHDAVDDPEADRVLDFGAIKTSGMLHSERLEKLIGTVEKILDAPILGLRGARGEKLKGNIRRLVTPEMTGMIVMSSGRVRPAKLSSRVTAAVIDLSVCAVAGLATAILYMAFDSTSEGSVFRPSSLDAIDLAIPTGLAGSIFLLSLLLYPMLGHGFFGRTLGSKIAKAQVTGEKGETPRFRNIFVRAASFPLSVLCLGFAPALVGRRTLHDRLAKTIVSRR